MSNAPSWERRSAPPAPLGPARLALRGVPHSRGAASRAAQSQRKGGAEARAGASANAVHSAAFAHQVVPWVQLSPAEKAKMVISILLRLCVIAGALYFFICSLSFLADGFRLMGGKGVG